MKESDASKVSRSCEIKFPYDHGFVVQIEVHSKLTAENLSGRAEHMISGKTKRFYSLEELLDFIRSNLDPVV